MQPFQYPDVPHVRLHGPEGYESYERYRSWLRDEFVFRCVYCLRREKWWTKRGTWHIDHWRSQKEYDFGILDYDNLIYSCSCCNLGKSRKKIPNPCEHLIHETVEVFEDGKIIGRTKDARRIIRQLGLDSADYVEFRNHLIGIYLLSQQKHQELFLSLMGYPDVLPNLARAKPNSNSRPEGLQQSCFARRRRGELPQTY